MDSDAARWAAAIGDELAAKLAAVFAFAVKRLLAAASPVWRTIVALCRFGGLRCPSEVFRLTWADVNFATGRMTVPNVKTAGQTGKAYRVSPLFGKLRPYLEDAHELAEPGSVFVIGGELGGRIRAKMDGPNGSNDANTRTAMLRLIKRAGLTPWPRLFHTLRASCETDLLDTLPMSAVTEWLGHSAAIALKHYARVPEHLFDRATAAAGGDAKSDARATQNATYSEAAGSGRERTDPPQTLLVEGLRRVLLASDRLCPVNPMTLWGFDAIDETPTILGTSANPATSAAQNPARTGVPDAVTAFVACLTAEQRVALAGLLPNGQAIRASQSSGAERAGPS